MGGMARAWRRERREREDDATVPRADVRIQAMVEG